jgi:hypothetical protein
MQYSVGQVLYIILSKKGQVYPMRIIEEITKKTLKGEEVNYVIQAGSDSSSTILLSQIEGEIYETPEEAKSVLIARATAQIEKIVEAAKIRAAEWYSAAAGEFEEIHELPQAQQPSAGELITLSDGTVARIKTTNIR